MAADRPADRPFDAATMDASKPSRPADTPPTTATWPLLDTPPSTATWPLLNAGNPTTPTDTPPTTATWPLLEEPALPPAPTGRRIARWCAIAAAVAVAVVVGYSDIAGGGSSTGGRSIVTPTPTSSASSFTPAQEKLLDYVDYAHDRCEPLGISDPRLRPKLVTALRCNPKSQRPDYVDYLQYPTKAAMESAFNKYARNPGSSGCTSREADPDSTTETVDHGGAIVWEDETDQTKYKGACFTRGGVRLGVWYDMDFWHDEEEPWILYRAGSKTMSYSKLAHWMTDPFR